MDDRKSRTRRHVGFTRMACRMMAPIVGALALWGAAPAAATEQPMWLRNGVPITGNSEIKSKGTITLTDTIPIVGTITVKCVDTGRGFAQSQGKGEVTTWTMSECTSMHCAGATLEAVGLPWHTELATVEGAVRNVITVGGGYKLKCTGSGIVDECPKVPNQIMTNAESGVTATFPKEKFTCTIGKGAAGELAGSQAIELVTGAILHVS